MGTLGKHSEDIFLLTGKHPFFPPEDTVFAFMKHKISKIKTCIRLVVVFKAKHTHTRTEHIFISMLSAVLSNSLTLFDER